ncbi:uncharacterized protein [Euphorbia lathyris]|uniref:uncharacterized protein n=1 Tax=Euphorbia lathyris TaxID=212925 RepID=UPI0033132FD1
MAETENKDNPTLTAKRKLEPFPISKDNEEEGSQNKYQKLQFLTHNDISVPNEENSTGNMPLELSNINSGSNFSIGEEKSVSKAQAEENAGAEVDEEEEDDTDFEDEEEEENGEAAAVDRKGKGIMIEEERDDSDDDDDNSGDGGSEVDSDCNELEDDPLAEVDLDNILPSRTRRRAVQPGVYIANDLDNDENEDGHGSDS